MSWQAQAWVWTLDDISPIEKLVALAMANYANPETGGGIRPGVGRLERMTGASRKSVWRAVKSLVARGYLIVVSVSARSGECGVYRMPVDMQRVSDFNPKGKMVAEAVSGAGVGHSDLGGRSQRPRGVGQGDVGGVRQGDTLNCTLNLRETKDKPNAREGALGSDISAENDRIKSSWEEWWAAYPRKDAKPAAEGAYRKAIKSVGADVLLTSLRRYQFSTERKFIPYPATWLNGRYWENEQDDPTDDWGLRAWKAKQPAIADGSLFAVSGYETDALLEIMAASGLDPKWRGDLDVLSGWLEGGYRPDSLCEVLAEAYGRNGAPRSLRALDGLVRARAVFYDAARMCWRRRSER